MGRKFLAMWLLAGVFFGYGSAIFEFAHGGSHCHRGDRAVEAPAP